MPDCGVLMFPTDYAIAPPDLAREAEARGFESLFFPEHTHIPTSRKTPWPAGGELPREYWHSHDPFVALAAAASVTSTLKLATGILLVPERDPIVTAKQVASLDLLSGGRVLLGIGAGWNVEELHHHGVRFEDRWKVTRESVLAMREIWSSDEAEFHGEFVDFEPIWSWPKPVQPGGPPILLGATSKWAYPRVLEYCDGWMPIARPDVDLAAELGNLRSAAEAAGRSLDELDLTVYGVGPDEAAARSLLELGFGRLVFGLPSAERDKVLPLLDRYAELARKLA